MSRPDHPGRFRVSSFTAFDRFNMDLMALDFDFRAALGEIPTRSAQVVLSMNSGRIWKTLSNNLRP